MRVLLVAYEFPPSPSPQSLRWAYLCRGLSRLGVEMHVLAPRIAGSSDGLPATDCCVVSRAYAGPLAGTVQMLSHNRHDTAGAAGKGGAAIRSVPMALNWKGRLIERVKAISGFFLYPDSRGEWNPWARRALARILANHMPSVLVTSHEPSSVLRLGLQAKRMGVRWVADMGDPVLAPYTPRRWQRKAMRLERQVCLYADHVTVTSEETRQLLMSRHRVPDSKITVVTQGYREPGPDAKFVGEPDSPRLELLYTGSLYDFRRTEALVGAIVRLSGVRLSVASRSIPDFLASTASRYPDSIRILGALAHDSVLELQRHADVLVDIGNDSTCQVAGKFYEYLGARRPILHIGNREGEAARRTQELQRGWVCENELDALVALLALLRERKQRGTLEFGLDLGMGPISQYDWNRLAEDMARILGHVNEYDR